MKVAVVGANGQLGQDVCAAFKAASHEVVALNHADIEISLLESVQQAFEHARPDLVINTGSIFTTWTGCETEAAQAFTVNALGARNVAQITHALGISVVHISTDYVFQGLKRTPYTEETLRCL